MFNLYGCERLIEWKKFRDSLETSITPLHDVAVFWSRAPFVNPFLDPQDSSKWPDPWHLILDDRFDDLAISLGMLYTLKLTRRFMNTKCEIHNGVFLKNQEVKYPLIVDDFYVLNLEYKDVVDRTALEVMETNLLLAK